MDYIEIEKENIPYRFPIDLAEEEFEMEVHYNNRFDFFTIDLYKYGKPLIYGEKVILNRPLFVDLANINLPKARIIPMDRSNKENRVSYDNLEKTVFLFVGDNDGLV